MAPPLYFFGLIPQPQTFLSLARSLDKTFDLMLAYALLLGR